MAGFFDMLGRAGDFMTKNPHMMSAAIQTLGAYEASRARSFDPGAGRRAWGRGLSGVGNTLMQGAMFQQQQKAREKAAEIAERKMAILEGREKRQQGNRSAYEAGVKSLFPGKLDPSLDPDATSEPEDEIRTPDPREALFIGLGPDVGGPALASQFTQKPTDVQRNYAAAKGTGFKGSLLDYQQALQKPPSPKSAKAYLIPGGESALSYDGGRTYAGPDGAPVAMPGDALPLGQETGVQQSTLAKTIAEAKRKVAQRNTDPPSQINQRARTDAATMAQLGTGPLSNIRAAIDAVAGGLGFDAAFGEKGFFPETQENRSALRRVRQLTKEAFIISEKGAIFEQKMLDQLYPNPDTFWANPVTEGRKLEGLRKDATDLRNDNEAAIASGAFDAKEVRNILKANRKLDRAINMMGKPGKAEQQTVPPSEQREIGKTYNTPRGPAIWRDGGWEVQ